MQTVPIWDALHATPSGRSSAPLAQAPRAAHRSAVMDNRAQAWYNPLHLDAPGHLREHHRRLRRAPACPPLLLVLAI